MNNWIGEAFNKILLENRESKNMKIARSVVRQYNPNIDPMQVLNAVRTDIPNSRNGECKFLAGVCRMYLEGELNDTEAIFGLNTALKYITSEAHINEYDNNLNNESAETLIKRFASVAQQDVENDKNTLSSNQYQRNADYDIVKIPSFEEAEKYGKYTSWCITHYDNMYDSYTHEGQGIFYFCLKKGFENVLPKEDENCPLDEYGLSMIAVSVNIDGSLNTCTCRWNHSNGGNDNIMDTSQMSQLLGVNFYDAFPPRKMEIIDDSIVLDDNICTLYNTDGGKYITFCPKHKNIEYNLYIL